MTTSQAADTAHGTLSNAFVNALISAMTEASGSPWLLAALPDAESNKDESEPVRINLTLGGSLQGEFLLEFDRAQVTMLASMCLRQPAVEFGAEQSQVLLKLIDAAISACCSTLAPAYGSLTIQAAFASEPASDRTNVIEMTAADDDSHRVSIRMYLNPMLAEALSVHSRAAGKGANAVESGGAAKPGQTIHEQVNLALVMDVELNVTLRFGQRQLTLREILELTSGSVIELDRQVEEPVELLLEGKVIARGEAVVIDGNYGLRVTEVPRPISSVLR
jgi:flagellar motor switch protein FliN